MATNIDLVQQLYVAYYNRPADVAGLNYWVAALDGGATIDQISKSFNTAPEYTALFAGKTADAIVDTVYMNLFGRHAEGAGLDFWGPKVASGAITTAGLVSEFLKGAVNADGTPNADGTAFANKVTVAEAFTKEIGTAGNEAERLAYANADAPTLAAIKAFLGGVTADPAGLAAALANVHAVASAAIPPAPTTTYTLTTGIDNLTGTGTNDIFNADQTQLSASDIVNGGLGNDTFNYTDSGLVGGTIPAAQFNGVETINIRNVNGTAAVAAVTEVAQVTFQAVTAGGTAATVTVGGATVTIAAGLTASAADIANAMLTGATVGNAVFSGSVAGYTAAAGVNSTVVQFTSSAVGNVADLTTSGVAGIAITQGVIGVASTGVTDTVNAGNFVGATDFNSKLSTSDVTFTGLSAGQNVGVIGNGSVANGNTSFSLGATVAAETINVVGGVTQGNITNTAGAGVQTATINSTGDDNGVDTVTLSAGGTIKTATINATTGFAATAVNGFATNGTLIVTGAGDVAVGTLNTNVGTVNASAATGAFSATLNSGITSFKGSAGGDVITTSNITATGAVIDGGAGADTLVIAASNDVNTAAKGAQYTNFETLRSLQTSSFDASLIAGVTAVQSGAAGAGFINLSAAQAAAVTIRANQNATAIAYSLKDATGTADTLTLTARGSSATTVINATGITADGFETINLSVGGGAAGNNVNFKADGVTAAAVGSDYAAYSFTSATSLTTLKVSGAKAAQVSIAGELKVTTLDASANTAGVDLITGGQTGALVVTATAADDKITLGAVGAGGSQSISAGAGNDKISGQQADIFAATKIDGGAGVDTLTITDSGTAVTINDQTFKSVVNVEKIAFSADVGLNFVVGGYANAIATANAGVLDVKAASLASTGAVTVDAGGLGGTNSLKLSLTDTAGTGAITVTSSNGGHDVITLATAGSHTAGNIIVHAENNTAGVTIDASGVAFGAGTGNSFNGGSGADTIKVGAIVASITGGAGADLITVTTNDHAAQTFNVATTGASTTTAFDVITGFTTNDTVTPATNNDTLHFAGTNVLTVAALPTGWNVLTAGVATKAGATLADFINVVATSTTAGVLSFSDGTNTWVGYSDGLAAISGADQLVELVGVQGATISTTAGANVIHIA